MDWIGIHRHWPAALAAILGIIASVAFSEQARRSAQDRISAEFSTEAENRARDLQAVLSRYEGTLEGFAAAFPSEEIDAPRFRAYAKNVFLASTMLQSGFESLGWAPRVDAAARAAFEATARQEGERDFAIRDKSGDGGFAIAPAKPVYYPLRFIEPPMADWPPGLELPTSPALDRAIATGAAAAAAPTHAIYGAETSLLYLPVYTSPSRGGALIGILTFRLSLGNAIDDIVGAFAPPPGIELYVIDDAAPAGQRIIYARGSPGDEPNAVPSDEAAVLVGPHWRSGFTFAGRDCTLVLRARPELLRQKIAGAGQFELAGGLLLTVFLTFYLIRSRARAERLRHLAETLQREAAVRRAAEDELRLTQAAMDRSSEAICLIHPSGRYLNVNDATCRQLGYTREELLGMSVFDIAVQTDPQTWAERWQHHKEVGSASIEGQRVTKDGRTIPVDITISHFQFGDNEYLFTVARDASTRRQIEHELRTARDLAEAASQAKSGFLANMSHELRTPLNAIIGFSEVISAALFGPLDARYRDYAQDINGSGHHLLRIINDLLDLSKVEAGRLELQDATVAIDALFETCRRMVADRAAAGGVLLDFQPTDLEIIGDELRLEQVLLNLVSNAVKFTPNGGEVTVAAACTEAGETEISVADTGIGMAPDDIPRALQPFGQIDNSLARPHGGTGLGLPLAQRLVELHGGTMRIDSAPGRGTRIAVVLPIRRSRLRQSLAEGLIAS